MGAILYGGIEIEAEPGKTFIPNSNSLSGGNVTSLTFAKCEK